MASSDCNDVKTPSKCQFCGESEIKWSCIDCDLYLCQLCSYNIHSKSKSSKRHNIINYTETETADAAEGHRKADLDNLTCSEHEGKKCFMFCSDCEKAICALYNRESHKAHDTDDLWDRYDDLSRNIKWFKIKVDEHLSILKSDTNKVQAIFDDSKQKHDEAKAQILQHGEEMKEIIEEYMQEILQKLESLFQPIQDELSYTQAILKELLQKKDELEKVLSSHSAEDIFMMGKLLNTNLPEITTIKLSPLNFNFIPSDHSEFSSSQIFGEIYEICDLELVKSYDTVLCAYKIVSHKEGTKYIGDRYHGELQKVQFDDEKVKIKKTEKITVYDMAMMENGDLVISTKSENLKLYTTDGTLKTLKSFSPLKTLGVHINEQNELFVGLIDLEDTVIKPESVRKVVILNQSGDIKHTYQYDNDNKRLFTWPWRIVTCKDTICVVDTKTLDFLGNGRVVALDSSGRIRWIYTGCQEEEEEEDDEKEKEVEEEEEEDDEKEEEVEKEEKELFWPQEITVTSTDIILISDYLTHTIHVLNQSGQLIVCHQLNGFGIIHPISMDIDHEGKLWFGCAGKQIHCLEFT